MKVSDDFTTFLEEVLEDQLTRQRNHARQLAGALYRILSDFPTSISDYGINVWFPAPGDGWDPSQEREEDLAVGFTEFEDEEDE